MMQNNDKAAKEVLQLAYDMGVLEGKLQILEDYTDQLAILKTQTCSNCAHWIYQKAPSNFGSCTKVHCIDALDTPGPEVNVYIPKHSAEWGKVLRTRADFGCVNFERK